MIGAVTVGELSVEIRPKRKVGIEPLFFMLTYSLDADLWRDTEFSFAEGDSLFEAVVFAFSYQVQRAIRAGLLHGYRTEDEALSTVRGQIRFGDQIALRFGIIPPIECTFDDFTDDILENRLLKAAAVQLAQDEDPLPEVP